MKSDVTQKNGVVTEGLRLSNKKKPKGTKKVLTRLRSLVFQDGQQLTKSPGVQVLQKPEAEFQISLGKYSFVTFPTFDQMVFYSSVCRDRRCDSRRA